MKPTKSKALRIRVKQSDLERVKRAAELAHLDLGSWARRTLMRAAMRDLRDRLMR